MFKKADLIIISVVCALVLSALLAVFIVGLKPAGYLEVSVDGEITCTYDMTDDVSFTVVTPDGGYVNCTIESGIADVTGASCPDLLCVNHRPVSRTGESIVCLPGKVVLTVRGHEDLDGVSK